MSGPITAIYDDGVFRPLEPIEMAQGTRVELQVATISVAKSDNEVDEETLKAYRDFVDRMESLPDNSPADGLTNRDHDRIIYGK